MELGGLLRFSGAKMIDPTKCSIELKIVTNGGVVKAYVTFRQGTARLSGFMIKDGVNGLWLEPPSIRGSGGKWFKLYFDENRSRFESLKKMAIAEYKKKMNFANPEDISENGEIYGDVPF